jgi:hypothetical protein
MAASRIAPLIDRAAYRDNAMDQFLANFPASAHESRISPP